MIVENLTSMQELNSSVVKGHNVGHSQAPCARDFWGAKYVSRSPPLSLGTSTEKPETC